MNKKAAKKPKEKSLKQDNELGLDIGDGDVVTMQQDDPGSDRVVVMKFVKETKGTTNPILLNNMLINSPFQKYSV